MVSTNCCRKHILVLESTEYHGPSSVPLLSLDTARPLTVQISEREESGEPVSHVLHLQLKLYILLSE